MVHLKLMVQLLINLHISGTSVSLGGSITDEVLFGGTGVISGSSQIVFCYNYVTIEHFLQSVITTVGTIGTGV